MGRTAVHNWTDYNTNMEIAKEISTTPVLDKRQEYRRNWFHCINKMSCNRLPSILKKKKQQQQVEDTRGDHKGDF